MAALLLALTPLTSQAQAPLAGASRLGESKTAQQTDPVRLTSPPAASATASPPPALKQPAAYVSGEFETFVQALVGAQPIKRFGAEFLANGADGSVDETTALPPPDYVVAPGDELQIAVWGSIDADLTLTVDRAGRITIPRVGTIAVAGVRLEALHDLLSRRVGQVFRNFQLSVSLGKLRGIRVFVTGFAINPGAHAVSGLASLTSALVKSGGPSASGSFRQIELRRRGQKTVHFDLYDLLLKGDRSGDPALQAGDVLHVAAVGPQVAVIGSVNQPGIFELRPGETIADAMSMAGGFSAVADRSRLTLERLKDRQSERIAELAMPAGRDTPLASGDLVRALSAVSISLASDRQAKRVRVEGEVQRPAEYVLPAGSTLADALRAAGGLTPLAFVFASEFNRESVRLNQQQNYDRALRDLETELARAATSERTTTADAAAASSARDLASARLIERLRALQPDGRIVLHMSPESTQLPEILLEDGDRLLIPARSTTVGVFGSVFNAASYLYATGRTLGDYLRLAGGPTRGADERSSFVVRANGTVLSRLQGESSWFSSANNLANTPALPGDTIFMPEEMNKTTFVQSAKDWTQILYQLGIGLAGIKSAVR